MAFLKQQVAVFDKGLMTDAGALNYPEGFSFEDLNCVITQKKGHRRRLGFDAEQGYTFFTPSTGTFVPSADVTSSFLWKAPANVTSKAFVVVQLGANLHFYDVSNSTTPVSGSKSGYVINLLAYKVDVAPGNAGKVPCSYDAGKGLLFITNKYTETLKVKYNPSSNTLTFSTITYNVRDFDGLSDSLRVDENPSSLSDAHKYNLYNQGWGKITPAGIVNDMLTEYYNNSLTTPKTYPSNTQQWWVGRQAQTELYDIRAISNTDFGTTTAPKGRFTLNYFYKDRTTVSGISGLAVEEIKERPTVCRFFAGRLFAAYSNIIFFSQILESESDVEKFYQDADPTCEQITDLIDTDGGTIKINEMDTCVGLFPLNNTLLVFATNGVWSITGNTVDGSFKATGYSVNKLSSLDIPSQLGLTDAEGIPVFVSSKGIYTVSGDPTVGLKVQSLTEGVIQSIFDEIPDDNIRLSTITFDDTQKKIFFLFKNTTTGLLSNIKYGYNRAFILDIKLSNWTTWSIDPIQVSNKIYCIMSPINTYLPYLLAGTAFKIVVPNGDSVVTGSDSVTIGESPEKDSSSLMMMISEVDAITGKPRVTFGTTNNFEYHDWDFTGNPQDYKSYFMTGYVLGSDISQRKWIPYITVYSNRTAMFETIPQFRANSCFLSVRFEWSDTAVGSKWSQPEQIYRNLKNTLPESSNGFPVVVTKHKIRGSGKAFQVRFESEEGKDFNVMGWSIITNTEDR